MELYESYIISPYPGSRNHFNINGLEWWAMTFTPQADHILRRLILSLYNEGGSATDNFKISVRETALHGNFLGPTVADAIATLLPCTNVGSSDYAKYTIDFPDGLEVLAGVTYAIVVGLENPATTSYVQVQFNSAPITDPRLYTGGYVWLSRDAGVTWTWPGSGTPSNYAIYFEEWGDPVPVEPPVAAFEAVVDGLMVTITNLSTGADTFEWDFGDGSAVSVEVNPVHAYAAGGTYRITLSATNSVGTTQSYIDVTVAVPVIPPAEASFTADADSGTAPLTVHFTNTTTGEEPISYSWDFGDGNTSTNKDPTHVFTDPGTYTVILTATNSGGSSQAVMDIVVSVLPAPVAAFTPSRTSGPVGTGGLSVQFTNESQGAASYRWEFGDGSASTATSPTHVFTAVGTFQVMLTAVGSDGQESTYSATIDVTANPSEDQPVANFAVSDTAPVTGEAVHFNNTSVNAESFSWDFGDGETSTATNPTHTYLNPGTYLVGLTVTGPGGSDYFSTSLAVTGEVVEPPPGGNLPTGAIIGGVAALAVLGIVLSGRKK